MSDLEDFRQTQKVSSLLILFIARCLSCLSVAGLAALGTESEASQSTVSVDITNEIKTGIVSGSMSAVTCWLTDSDLHRPRLTSMEQAYADMGVGAIRFPYGHLADNYLWQTPGTYDQTDQGLTPRPADDTRAPGGSMQSWSLESDGTFKDDLDFDEFMSMCQALNVKPLIVVNALSHKYGNSIVNYEQLKTNAVEWVKYAKEKGYEVAYWQIGNEMDHHQDIITREEYIALYFDFAAAMKAEDPSIAIGTGILGNTNYYNSILAGDQSLVDFLSVHQYMSAVGIASYSEYKDFSGPANQLININKATTANQSRNLPILVTECNSHGMPNLDRSKQNLYAMIWFEQALSILSQPNIENLFFWGSHDPWDGDPVSENATTYTLFDTDNNRTPRGEMHKALNDYLLDDMVSVSASLNYVQAWAGANSARDELSVFLVNRDTTEQTITVDTGVFTIDEMTSTWQYVGQSTETGEYTTGHVAGITINDSTATFALPAFSVSIVRFSGGIAPPPMVDPGSDQTLYLGHVAPWTPVSINTVSWYDASDTTSIVLSADKVAQWKDKSGNDHHVTQETATAQPKTETRSMNSLNVLDFDGGDWLRNTSQPTPVSGNLAVFVAGSIDSVDNSADSLVSMYDGSYTNDFQLGAGNAGQFNGRVFCSAGTISMTGGPYSGNHIFSLEFNHTDGEVRTYANGVGRGSTDGYTTELAASQNLCLFASRNPTTAQSPDGALAEVILVEDCSEETRQKIEGYLVHKWGLDANLPVDHPHKNEAPTGALAVAYLDGTVSYSNMDSLTTNWTHVGGSGTGSVAFDDASAVDTTATFSATGTYILQLTADDGLNQVIDSLTVTVADPQTFATWISIYDVGGLTGIDDDPDGDGQVNGIENYFGTDPSISSRGMEVIAASSGVSPTFTFTHPVSSIPTSDLTAAYIWSKDLSVFYADGASDGSTSVTFEQGQPIGGVVTTTAIVTGSADRIFVAIQVTENN